jgi:hypothetical protein
MLSHNARHLHSKDDRPNEARDCRSRSSCPPENLVEYNRRFECLESDRTAVVQLKSESMQCRGQDCHPLSTPGTWKWRCVSGERGVGWIATTLPLLGATKSCKTRIIT